jgi:hypothetical protein
LTGEAGIADSFVLAEALNDARRELRGSRLFEVRG